jgi:opacity protein-like surface antigen
MIKKNLALSLLSLSCSLPITAGTMGSIHPTSAPYSPLFYVGAFGGYGAIDGAEGQYGRFTQGRLTLGFHGIDFKNILLGAELGVQSGNSMRLSANADLIELTGGLPIQATLKPFFDALVTAKYRFQTRHPLSAIIKGGIAYRQLQLDNRSSSRDSLSKVNGEFQAGLGYNITEHVMLTAMYQGIYSGSKAHVRLNSLGDVTISRIPTQQAGFLGVEYSFL